MCHGLFSFLIAQIVFRISKDKKGALNLFPSSKHLCFMPCSIHGNFRLSIPELKKIKKFYGFWRKRSITQLNIKWDSAMIN